MQSDPNSLVGSTLQDRYRIDAFLAEGAMGAVYQGHRVGLERAVAIKFLGASFASSPNAKQRFEREARVMSQLDHPNCVSVIDFGVTPSPFIVMEFVTGETLRERMDEGEVSVPRALYLAKGILAGLAHAHEQSIVHRDIKPANVMITRAAGTDGLVRILDFGLAKLRDGASSDVSSASIVVGTPNYMSPEQAMGSDVDNRTDVYATGILLFELLTGKKPYQSDVALHILLQHREDPIPRLAATAPEREFPEGLQQIIDTAMAKDPKARFADVIEFANAIRALEAGDLATLRTLTQHTARMTGGEETALARPASPKEGLESTQLGALIASTTGSKRWPWLAAIPLLAILAGTALGFGPFAGNTGPAKSLDPLAASATDSAEMREKKAALASAARVMPEDADLVQGDSAQAPVAKRPSDELTAEPSSGSLGADASTAANDAAEFVIEDDEEGEEDLSWEELAADTPNVDPPAPAEEPVTLAVNSVSDAVSLSKQGKRSAAIAGLKQLARKQPKNARLSLVLGNLYFDQMWWSAGLEQYEQAIRKSAKLRRSPLTRKNAIRALGSSKRRRKAQGLLRTTIGKASLAQLRRAAKRDTSPLVRKRAALVVRQLTRKPKRTKKKRTKKKRQRPRPRR